MNTLEILANGTRAATIEHHPHDDYPFHCVMRDSAVKFLGRPTGIYRDEGRARECGSMWIERERC